MHGNEKQVLALSDSTRAGDQRSADEAQTRERARVFTGATRERDDEASCRHQTKARPVF
jgi:hypothetical protein